MPVSAVLTKKKSCLVQAIPCILPRRWDHESGVQRELKWCTERTCPRSLTRTHNVYLLVFRGVTSWCKRGSFSSRNSESNSSMCCLVPICIDEGWMGACERGCGRGRSSTWSVGPGTCGVRWVAQFYLGYSARLLPLAYVGYGASQDLRIFIFFSYVFVFVLMCLMLTVFYEMSKDEKQTNQWYDL